MAQAAAAVGRGAAVEVRGVGADRGSEKCERAGKRARAHAATSIEPPPGRLSGGWIWGHHTACALPAPLLLSVHVLCLALCT